MSSCLDAGAVISTPHVRCIKCGQRFVIGQPVVLVDRMWEHAGDCPPPRRLWRCRWAWWRR